MIIRDERTRICKSSISRYFEALAWKKNWGLNRYIKEYCDKLIVVVNKIHSMEEDLP